ncbi:transcription factor LRL1 [Ricinus communis]|uniref:DNA binding protein, putative n=1 Tax=Ricinus communis TaxID=3988 RepID=B9S450_RICCO|nr:transcription factor LRL1 [Ricinus communis]EEF41731.1 DNA binding protein, putative [Ricinus communis]|eukprot:XP_002520769.1 transcription factor bHLH66 isoform X2 [Ricinus communis]
MDGQNGYPNALELMMMMNIGWNVNDVSYVPDEPEDDSNQHFITLDGGGQNPLPLPLLFGSQRTPLNYYEFLTENSSKAPDRHVLESIPSPVGDSHFIQGTTEIQKELFYNSGMPSSSNPKHAGPSLDMDSWKLSSYPYMFSMDNHESSLNVRYNEEDSRNQLENLQDQNQAQSHIVWTQEPPSEVVANVSQSQPRAKVSPSVFLSNPGSNPSRQRAISSDRRRRERIAERLKALQELLPHSVEGSQIVVMDEIIDYVKYLQLQMKELSRSRLEGHLCSGPAHFLEGYHPYILHQQTMNEPLEETMAKLLKVNSSAATKFLESKGLFVMPMALADRLKQAI